MSARATKTALEAHVSDLLTCTRCPKMLKPVVSGGPVVSKAMLIGQAPGIREPVVGKPFAWTAGRTLFRWFAESCGVDEEQFRSSIYMAAVCRCFPGRNATGGDRVPDTTEIANCSHWLNSEFLLLRPRLVIPVGKLAIAQLLPIENLNKIIGHSFRAERVGISFDVIPLPHPSGASPWHRIEPGKSLLQKALSLIAAHPAWPRP